MEKFTLIFLSSFNNFFFECIQCIFGYCYTYDCFCAPGSHIFSSLFCDKNGKSVCSIYWLYTHNHKIVISKIFIKKKEDKLLVIVQQYILFLSQQNNFCQLYIHKYYNTYLLLLLHLTFVSPSLLKWLLLFCPVTSEYKTLAICRVIFIW